MAWKHEKKKNGSRTVVSQRESRQIYQWSHIFSTRSGRESLTNVWWLFWETHSRYSPGNIKSGALSSIKLQTCFCLKRVQPSQHIWIFCWWCYSLACLWKGLNLGGCHQIQWQHNFSSLLLICLLDTAQCSKCLPCIMGPSLKQSFQNCIEGGPNREWDIMLGSRQKMCLLCDLRW